MYRLGVDGGVLVFPATHPKWSYVRTDANGMVVEVAEKKVISNTATVGIYWYRKGSEYVRYAERMIAKNFRVNGEFYVAPVFNEYLDDGKVVAAYGCYKMHGLGTPEDLEAYLA
jgi:dTDP-glucose pyrophosphorylase